MCNIYDGDNTTFVVNAVDGPIGPAVGTVAIIQRRKQTLADAVGTVQKRAGHELIGRDRHGFR
jgi:hypothetical protein